jgi:hypothetical protein
MGGDDANANREQWMWRTTRELARSGACKNWREIELKLGALGYPLASQHWSHSFRQVLDRLCVNAKATPQVANDIGSPPALSA